MQPARKLSPPASLDEAWMTVADARAEADVSLQTIYNWINRGRLKTETFGGRQVIAREEWQRFNAERAAAAGRAAHAAAKLAGSPAP